MSNYVDTPVDWVRKQPLRFERATMHVMMLRADELALRSLCDELVHRPSAGKVKVEPLLSGVILCFATIDRGSSVPEQGTGFLSENECVFFVPVRGREGVPFTFGALAPLAYVDNPIAVVAGREIYGFPKFPAESVVVSPGSASFEVTSFAQRAFGPQEKARPETVVRVREAKGTFSTEDLPTGEDVLPIAIATSLLTEAASFPASLIDALTLGALRTVNLLFLKQFRDSVAPEDAAYQEILTAPARISNPSLPRLHLGQYDVEIPALKRPAIAEWLGLAPVTRISKFASLKMDFEFGAGTKLWTSIEA